MKYGVISWLVLAGLWGLTSQAIDIIIKTDDKQEEKKEEPKEEDKGPELPKPSQLAINMINNTPDSEFTISAWVQVKDQSTGFIVAQGTSAKETTTTLALLNAPEGSSFELKKSEVILVKSPANVHIKCKVQGSPQAEASDTGDKDAKEEPSMEAKKSIDFWLYTPENQQLPSCVIMVDSL